MSSNSLGIPDFSNWSEEKKLELLDSYTQEMVEALDDQDSLQGPFKELIPGAQQIILAAHLMQQAKAENNPADEALATKIMERVKQEFIDWLEQHGMEVPEP